MFCALDSLFTVSSTNTMVMVRTRGGCSTEKTTWRNPGSNQAKISQVRVEVFDKTFACQKFLLSDSFIL